jgi:hypothetical protein
MKRISILPAFAALLIPLLIVACGGGDKKDEQQTPEKSAQETLSDAAAAAQDLDSFHFKLTQDDGPIPLPLNLTLDSAEGDVAVPGKIKADIKAKASGIGVSVKVIGIDNKTWVTNPFTKDWQSLGSNTNIQDYANPAALVTQMLPAVKDAQFDGQAEIDGAQTNHITGTMDSGDLEPALGFAEPGQTVKVEAWVGTEDNLPRRLVVNGRLTPGEKESASRRLDLSKFNQPVDIQAPE